MTEWRLAPAPPPLDPLTPLPARKAPTASASFATLEALSPLKACGRRQSLVLPPVVPEGSEPPVYVPFCDQRCQASRASCAAWAQRGGDTTLAVETAPLRTHYDVAGGTPITSSRTGMQGSTFGVVDNFPPYDTAAHQAGRKSVTFRSGAPNSEFGTDLSNPEAFLSRSPRSEPSRATTRESRESATGSTSSPQMTRWGSAINRGLSRASFCSSKTSIGTVQGKEQRGLFRHHYLSELSEEDKEKLKQVGKCSLTNLVARFKEAGVSEVAEPTLEVVHNLSSEPRSELLYLRREKEPVRGVKSVHFSRFVQPNYIKTDLEGIYAFRPLESVVLRSTRKSVKALTNEDHPLTSYLRVSVAEHVTQLFQVLFLCLSERLASILTAATRPKKLATFVACCLIVCIVSLILFVVVGGNYLGDKFLLLKDPALRGDPGYLVDFLGEKCIYLKNKFEEELRRLEALNLRLGWRTVTFNARDGRLVSALWLPSSVRQAPRVVIAHSGLSNYLESAVQSAAYYLRSMNISVLAPNLRHHGGFGQLERQVLRWQNQELDILGAWDFAVNDPEGLLGGPLDDRFVGLMGFDFGGFGVQLAFGMEPRIPSMFLDGSVHKLRELLRQKIEARVTAWLVWMFDEQAWTEWKDLVHRDLDKDISTSILKERTTPGFAAITHCRQDRFVPYGQSQMLMDELSNSAVTVLMQWYPEFEGPRETCKRRSETYMDHMEEYKAFLCSFWSRVFDQVDDNNDIPPRCKAFGPPPGISS